MPPRLRYAAYKASTFVPRPNTTCQCSCRNAFHKSRSSNTRGIATSTRRNNEMEVESADRPRWRHTPPAMVAPVRLRPRVPFNDYIVNEDPRRLDQVYQNILGNGQHRLLTEEVRWLAVTHKSFDQGRRGYNDRLAFFGELHRLFAEKLIILISLLYRQEDSGSTDFTGPPQLANKYSDSSTSSRLVYTNAFRASSVKFSAAIKRGK